MTEKKKIPFYRRALAYFIDLLIVAVLSSLLSLLFTDTEKSTKYSKELISLTEALQEKKITTEEYYAQYDVLNYEITINQVPVTIITCSVIAVYYVVMCYFCHGITLGKYLMKLKIVSAKDHELSIVNYLLRSLIINLLLNNLASVILVKVLPKASFIAIYPKVSNGITLLLLVSLIMMMYREDGRGLHDLLAGTKVIDIKNMNKENADGEIADAKVIEEKHNQEVK